MKEQGEHTLAGCETRTRKAAAERQRQLLPPIAGQATPWDTGMLVTRSWKLRNGKSWRI